MAAGIAAASASPGGTGGGVGGGEAKEMNRRLQSMLEETLLKNINLQQDVENLTKQVQELTLLATRAAEGEHTALDKERKQLEQQQQQQQQQQKHAHQSSGRHHNESHELTSSTDTVISIGSQVDASSVSTSANNRIGDSDLYTGSDLDTSCDDIDTCNDLVAGIDLDAGDVGECSEESLLDQLREFGEAADARMGPAFSSR